MSTTSLKLQSFEAHPKSQYNPKHSRALYFDTESRTYIARATIGEEVIVEVEDACDIKAGYVLGSRLIDIFRALRAAA